MKSLHFLVADLPYCIAFDDDAVDYKRMLPSHGPFYVARPTEEPVLTIHVGSDRVSVDTSSCEHVGLFPSGDSSYDVYRQPEGGYKIIILDLTGEMVCVFSTTANFDQCNATLLGTPQRQQFGLQNCIMVCYAFCGAHHGILMMHSSVIRCNGKGYLFLGKSGTGKSTHSSLWLKHIEGTELLNDDNPAVRLTEDEARVYGTPWSGKTPCYRQEHATIGGFLRLHQAPINEIRKLNPIEAFGSILSSCSTMIWDEPSYNGICNTISAICRQAGAYEMKCLPDAAAAQMSYRTMSE